MGKGLVREINQYTKNLKCDRDWQVKRVYNFEHRVFAKEKVVPQHEANKIVKKLERHWKILITQVYPESNREYEGESWTISSKAAAINVVTKALYPSVIIHEVSHGIVDCFTEFHKPTVKEPGHGPFWCAVYLYNIQYILGLDLTNEMKFDRIRVANPETVHRFRDYFINA